MTLNNRSLVYATIMVASIATLATVARFTMQFGWPDLDGALGFVIYVFTESGSARYVSLVLLGALSVWTTDPARTAMARRRETAAMFLVMLAALPTTALVVEHALKPAIVASRPSHERLANAGFIGDLEAFYALDKQARREQLQQHADVDAVAQEFRLHPHIAAHWLHEAGSSFPSAHALNAFLAASLLLGGAACAPTARRRLVAAFMLSWAGIVAWTRVALLVHRPFDVAAGAALGCVIGTLLTWGWWRIAKRMQPALTSAELRRQPSA